MDSINLQHRLNRHSMWLEGNSEGKQFIARGEDLRGVNLHRANLQEADLSGANLQVATLGEANLTGADLGGANLRGANLCVANLIGANLTHADLSGADLRGADLEEATFHATNLVYAVLPYPIYQAYLGQFLMHTNKEYIRIGCQYMSIDTWLKTNKKMAVAMGLEPELYIIYKQFIRWYANEYKKNKRRLYGQD